MGELKAFISLKGIQNISLIIWFFVWLLLILYLNKLITNS
ncbi:uncharacterized protein METZ01_LOCUS88509 [marine metagenome]|uniref:Uncharacterized protein n=1 Tax=marine metagenome TaxID=408172 RepID=A0A381V5N0_9ZZZZ